MTGPLRRRSSASEPSGSSGGYTWVKQDGEWKVDGLQRLEGDIPDDAVVVDMKLASDFEFDFDPSAITSGNLAFRIENTDTEEHAHKSGKVHQAGIAHEMAIGKLPEGLSLEETLQLPAPPPLVGIVTPLAPGGTTNVVLTEPLEPGNYALLCFLPTEEGTTHVEEGMIAEFTVP